MRFHLFPFRTEKLSSLTPMVLRFSRGRVGSRLFKVRSYDLTFFLCPARSGYRLDGRWGNALSRRGPSRRSPSETGFGGRSKAGSSSRYSAAHRLPVQLGDRESLNPCMPRSPCKRNGACPISLPRRTGNRSELRPRLAAWGRNLFRTVVGTVRQETTHPGIDPRVCRFQGFVLRGRADR